MTARFKRLYGASPLHLLAFVATLLIGGAAVAGWFQSFPGTSALKVVAWFIGAIVAHDLVAMPLYSLLDRVAFGAGGSREARDRSSATAYIRIPAILSSLLFLVFFPEILRLGDRNFFVASGLHQRVFLARYLLTCGVLFALSGVAYAVRLRRGTRPSRARNPRAPRSRALARRVAARRRRGGRRRGGTRRS